VNHYHRSAKSGIRAESEEHYYLMLFTDKPAVEITCRLTAENRSIQQFSTYLTKQKPYL